jgi:hypothetical protein
MLNIPTLGTLKYIGRKVIRRPILKKIEAIKEDDEQRILFEYSIKSAVQVKYVELKEKVMKKERLKKDVFIPLAKLSLLGSKIHLLNTTYHKKDFKAVMNLFKEIEKEMKNV